MTEHFIFSGHDTTDLAARFGTPLYVFSEDIFLERAQSLKDAFNKTGADYEINFAGKSFLNMAVCRLVEKAGISLDTASGGELFTALSAGFNPAKITLHGNNKTEMELKEALEAGAGRIVVDSADELERLDRLTRETGINARILFRINPGVDAHTNELINTGKTDTKFGIPLEDARELILTTREMPGVETIGLHAHIGSQVTDEECFVAEADIMSGLYSELLTEGLPLCELNLGGGFGIAYRPGDASFDPATYIPRMVERIRKIFQLKGIEMPRLMIEPGRFLSAEAGITLYTVGTRKNIRGVRTYVTVDGGMADNPRPALYGAEYDAVICNREMTPENSRAVRVSGNACETDTLISDIKLADPRPGDLLAVRHTGAYNYTMASNYNRLPRPAVVLLSGERSDIIVERETYEDLIAQDRIPDWLEQQKKD